MEKIKKVHSVTLGINTINIVFIDELGYYTVGSIKFKRRGYKMTKKEFKEQTTGDTNTPLSEVVLNDKRGGYHLTKVLSEAGYYELADSDEVEVKVYINGVELSVVDFSALVESMWERMEKEIKDKMDYMTTEEYIEKLSSEKANKKVGELVGVLQNFIDYGIVESEISYKQEKEEE